MSASPNGSTPEIAAAIRANWEKLTARQRKESLAAFRAEILASLSDDFLRECDRFLHGRPRQH